MDHDHTLDHAINVNIILLAIKNNSYIEPNYQM